MKTINHECYVSLEVAKLLKEVGFNWEVKTYYHYLSPYDEYNLEFDSISTNYNHLNNADFSAPTLDAAQRWLRDVKNIAVHISSTRYSEWEYIIRKINQLNYKDNTILALTACRFYTYEEALEAGIKKILEMILEKVE